MKILKNSKILVLLFFSISQSGISQSKLKNTISLDSCVKIALINNPELKVYGQNSVISKSLYKIQKADQYPSINLSSEYYVTDQYNDLNEYSAGNASLQVYQPIWQNGKIRASIEKAKLNSETTEIEFLINRSDVIYYITVNYINLIRYYRIHKLNAEMLKQMAITVDAAKERFQLGVAKRSDVLKAETEYSNVQYYAIQVETSEKIAQKVLLNAMGLPTDSTIFPKDFFEQKYTDLEISDTDSLINFAENNLPELMLIKKRIDQQEISVIIEKKKQFPEIGAFASYNWIDNPLYTKEFYGSTGLSIRLHIFNGFRKKNTVTLEKIKLEQLNYQKNEIALSVTKEIQIARLSLEEANEKISNAKSQVKSSKETLEVTTEEYKQGLSSMLELIITQYADFEAKRNLVNAQAEYHLAVTLLKRKTGILMIEHNY